MLRIITWTLGLLLAAQPIAKASELDALSDVKKIADKALANKSVKNFGDLLLVIHGDQAKGFINQLPKSVKNAKAIPFEVNGNTMIFTPEAGVATKLEFSQDVKSFKINGMLVTEDVLASAIAQKDPTLITKHLEKINPSKPALISLLQFGSRALFTEAHASIFGASYPSMYGMQPWSPYACYICQGSYFMGTWLAPWDLQNHYWGAMTGYMARSRYSNLINNTTASPYRKATQAVQ
jgi:hypothetical protein